MRYIRLFLLVLCVSCGGGGGGGGENSIDSNTSDNEDNPTNNDTPNNEDQNSDTPTSNEDNTESENDTSVIDDGKDDNSNENDQLNDTPTESKFEKASAEESARFLTQATFGPTIETINAMTGQTYEFWLNEQIELEPSYLYSLVKDTPDDELEYSEHVETWWKIILESEDQLRQRVAFALSEIFVISDQSGLGGNTHGLTNYYDILIRNAFGNYRDLLEEVTLSPMMGIYLSMLGNQKPNPEKNIRPDENYAREIMQLFSIGLYELNIDGSQKLDSNEEPIPSYEQKTIEAFSHIYTGWTYRYSNHFKWPSERNYIEPMAVWKDYDNTQMDIIETYHDLSSQTLLNGLILSENTNAEAGLKIALDNIFNHKNVGPFISKQLIQRLITSNPSPGYIQRVASKFNDNGKGVRGDLKSVVLAIYLDEEARIAPKADSNFGKVKEPLLKLSSMWRAFKASSNSGKINYNYPEGDLKQGPFKSPTVFNFFSPNYSHQGEVRNKKLLSPELQIHDESSVTSMSNRLYSFIRWRVRGHDDQNKDQEKIKNNMYINLSLEKELSKVPDDLIDHLNLLLLAGTMSDHLRTLVKEMIEFTEIKETDSEDRLHSRTKNRATDAIITIMNSPEFTVQR